MKRIVVCLAVLGLVACTTPHDKPGPLGRGVRADAPPDTVGVVLSWTPDQTIVNLRRSDQIFATHTIHHGVRGLPRLFTVARDVTRCAGTWPPADHRGVSNV